MSRRARKNPSPLFNVYVSLEAIRGEKSLAELAKPHGVHANQIVDWKNQLLERSQCFWVGIVDHADGCSG